MNLGHANTTHVCRRLDSVNSRGVFVGDIPFEFSTPVLLVQLALICFITRSLHYCLRNLGQPTVVSHLIAGVVLGPSILGRILPFKQNIFPYASESILRVLSLLGLMFFLFIAGVKTNPSIIKKYGRKAAAIGITAFIVPMVTSTAFALFLRQLIDIEPGLDKALPLVPASQSLTGFLVITCLLTELKILNTELSRLAVSSALVGDMIGLTMAVVSITTQGKDSNPVVIFCGVFGAVALVLFLIMVLRPTMLYIIRMNPDKQTKAVHTFVIVFGVLLSGLLSVMVGQYVFFGPVILGLSMPDGPPIGTALVGKLECFVSGIIFPAYVAFSGLRANIFEVSLGASMVVGLIVTLHFIVKLTVGTLASLYFKVPKQEALVMGLMMNGKGLVELLIFNAWRDVKALYDPSKRYLYSKISNIQSNKQDAPLRVVACVHTPENVPAIVNLLEVSYATRESPVIVVALELVELMGRQVAMLVAHQSRHMKNTSSPSTEQIINAFHQYELHNNGLVSVQAYTAMSHMETMHEDVCNLALEKRVNIAIIPFHRQWSIDGKVGPENRAIRSMNLTILEKAPCSVGILVDRNVQQRSMSLLASRSIYRVGAIFTGGLDDGEVLAYAARMARHQRVNLTVIRFLAFGCDNARERKVDNDTMDEFKRSNADNDQVRYKDEMVKNGEGLSMHIKGLGSNYDYLIVGKNQRKESQLFYGLDDQWSECPELGIIGDMLASPDHEGKCSILVVRQHNRGRGGMTNSRSVANDKDFRVHDSPYEENGKQGDDDRSWRMTMETMA
ncbi:hypothetical protein Sjap_003782 [Stephania japonica]|uniref:Cation/H+ exchanger domain-containing protein n=1 Tax=Stephania japonica TaxID=461633 RepID=A0AAP0KRI6_9MAGN